MDIYTIGHSSHSKEFFEKMLKDNSIEVLADVRAFPGSRKWPQFSKDIFPEWLEADNISYLHFSKLGGRRRKSKEIEENINAGWNNQSFHNYADYTLTDEFKEGIDELLAVAIEKRVAYCCSERHPSRCHRFLISNWLVANGHNVFHIIDGKDEIIEVIEHEIAMWGAPVEVIEESVAVVVYPESEEKED